MSDYEAMIMRNMENFRKEDEAFDSLVKEITDKIEEQIREKNAEKSFNPKSSNDYKIRIKVKAVPISKEEMDYLLNFLRMQYISKVAGDRFALRKCLFSEQYYVRSKSYYD